MNGLYPSESQTAEAILQAMLVKYGLASPYEIESWLLPSSTQPLFDVRDDAELTAAAMVLRSPVGRIRLRIDLDHRAASVTERELTDQELYNVHPMVRGLRRASTKLMLGAEVRHPLEDDNRDLDERYASVTTVRSVPSAGIALSTRRLPLHQDGLGTCGSIRYVAMCLDQAPEAGGEQSYVNVLAHGIQLAARNRDRFIDATRPDALTIIRSTGSQRVKVAGPIFYLDETGLPAVHFRLPGGEYAVRPSARVGRWFDEFARELEHAATQVRVVPGDCVVVDNLSVAHARAAYTDLAAGGRRLSRKWYAINQARSGLTNQTTLLLHPGAHGIATRSSESTRRDPNVH